MGANLALRLLHGGHRVHLLLRPDCATWRIRSFAADVNTVEADLRDAEGVARTLHEVKPDWIFHLGVYGAYPVQVDLGRMVQTNVQGAVNLVQAALPLGFEALVNAGSSSEYGYQAEAPAESRLTEPNSNYAWSKASATLYWRFSAQSNGAWMPTLRLYSVFGPYEEPSRFLPTLITRGLRGGLPPLADPRVARDYVYVDDVVDAFIRAAERGGGPDPGAVYNVGTGTQSTLADVVAIARRLLPIREEPAWGSMANRSWDTNVWVSDNRRIARDLRWKPRHSLAEGFGRFVEWFEANPGMAEAYDPTRAGAVGQVSR